MIGSATQALNAAKFVDARSRSPYSGAGFAAINAPAGAGSGQDGLNAATVSSNQLLADLNHFRAAPQLAAAVAGVTRARRDETEPAGHEAPSDTRHQELQKQAQKLVGQTFFGAMLKQMRDSPFKSDLFDGGRGGEVFHSLMDQHLADQMSRGAGNDLVQSIVKHLEKLSNQHRTSTEEESVKLNQKPVTANPFANVRVHVAPSLRS
jgi:Rod binding domain-containing protein